MVKKYITDLKKEFAGYNQKSLSKDIMAGLTVAAVALPLALAFGVSSGANAAAGLITAIFAGLIIGTLSGASYQISGPTGAMAAILLSISAKYGIQGVLVSGALSGMILLILALFKTGKLVSYIPAPVITGFTTGIAIIIFLGQLDNFFGTTSVGETAIAKLVYLATQHFSPNIWAIIFGGLVILIMTFYPKKLNSFIPGSLFSLIAVLIFNLVINKTGTLVSEVGQIPRSLMTNQSLIKNGIDFAIVPKVAMSAVSIAALGMVESLLCGASAGKMKNERIDAQRELIAQGIGNIIIPLFGGVPATAAIARTSVAIKSGGKTRLVSVFHSITLILSMFLLGGVMSRIPLSALAGVLIVTAWRMNEWREIKYYFKNKFKTAVAQFLITAVATVVLDLTMAIVVGVVLSMFLFIIRSCNLSVIVSDVDTKKLEPHGLTGDYQYTKLIYLSGPMFFGTQDRLTDEIHKMFNYQEVVMSMRGVPSIDSSAIAELKSLYEEFVENGIEVIFCGVQPEVKRMFDRSGLTLTIGEDRFMWDAVSAIEKLESERK